MNSPGTPVDLAKDVVNILRTEGFCEPDGPLSSRQTAILKISEKICAGADLNLVAYVVEDYLNNEGKPLIFGGETLLHVLAGCEPQRTNDHVLRALKIAAERDAATGARYFSLEARDAIHGRTALHLAAKIDNGQACAVLIESGADPRALTWDPRQRQTVRTPLEVALEFKSQNAARVISSWFAMQKVSEVLKQNAEAPVKGTTQP